MNCTPIRVLWVLLFTVVISYGYTYPLKVGPTGRYLVDKTNVPVMIVGDSPQSFVVNLTEAQANQYFSTRRSQGFNAAWIEVYGRTFPICLKYRDRKLLRLWAISRKSVQELFEYCLDDRKRFPDVAIQSSENAAVAAIMQGINTGVWGARCTACFLRVCLVASL
jgi:Protein of unknown function (DUF4038)